MKKTILLILIILPNFIFGQEEEVDAADSPNGSGQYKWEIGINGGVNITNVSGFKSDSTGATLENNIGRLYGVTLVYHLNKVFAIKTDIDFENKGGNPAFIATICHFNPIARRIAPKNSKLCTVR